MNRGFADGLTAADAAALARVGIVRRNRRGSYLMLESDRSDNALVVIEGRVKIVTTNADGRESVIAVRGRGELIGELIALAGDDSPRSASVCALDDVVVARSPRPSSCSSSRTAPRLLATRVLEVVARVGRDREL